MRQYLHCSNGFQTIDRHTDGGWIDISDPTDDDIRLLVDDLGIPADFIDDLRDIDERPRVDIADDWTLSIVRIPVPQHSATMPFSTIPLGVMTSARAIVTLSFFKSAIISDFIEYSNRKAITIAVQTDFVLHILFSATFWYLSYLKHINERISRAERALERSVENADLLNLMRLQRSLVLFNTSLKGNQVLLERLYGIFAADFDRNLYQDLLIEMKQADNTVVVYSDILEDTMNAYGSIISNNVNQIMKRMTSITIILMVPTLVASFYGMNVKGLTLAEMPFSFYIVIFVAAVFTVLTYIWLRKLRWF